MEERLGLEGAAYVAFRRGAASTWQELTLLAKALGTTTALLSFFITADRGLLFLLRAGWRLPRVVEMSLDQTDWADLVDCLRCEVHRYDPEVNETALQKVREDKRREATDGHDGTWVAHPGLVQIAREEFDKVLGSKPHQKEKLRSEVSVTASQITDTKVPGGTVTVTGPSSVGTCTFVPSSASYKLSGRSTEISNPSLRK